LRAHPPKGLLTPEQRRAARDITRCRTAALGGHLQKCTACGDERPAYNSCRNRHCPKCQALPQAKWVEKQAARVLPVTCFHVVFTLPAQLRTLVRAEPRVIYDLLFATASSTLLALGRDPSWLGAELGITAVLHTWARDLSFHPHVHCIVTAGGLTADNRWLDTKRDFLFPTKVMATLFRGKFLDGLSRLRISGQAARALDTDTFGALLDKLYATSWNVYAKAPFAGPKHIFEYLGRYTHRVGISNHRLLAFDERGVTFRTRGNDSISLPADDFVARFLQHILPSGFVKIRHYGLMANGNAVAKRERARTLLAERSGYTNIPTPVRANNDWQSCLRDLTGIDLAICPRCACRAVVRVPLPLTANHRPLAAARPRSPPSREAAA